MSCLGLHIALSAEQRAHLEGLPGPLEMIDYVQEELEENWDEEHFLGTDKAWDAIHRCLGEFPAGIEYYYPQKSGTPFALPEDHGSYPLRHCILGGKRLFPDELPDGGHYLLRLIEPNEAIDIAKALAPIDKKWMRARYFRHCRDAWPAFGEDDFEFTWERFQPLRDWFARMAGNGRAVIFTADQ